MQDGFTDLMEKIKGRSDLTDIKRKQILDILQPTEED